MDTKTSAHGPILVLCAAALLGPAAFAAQPVSGPCTLLTTAQVSSALGVSVGAGAPIATTGCAWTAPKFMTTLSLLDAGRWEQMKAPTPGMTKTPVAGLGDDAFYTVLGERIGSDGMATLTVRKGGTAYVFKVYTKRRTVLEQVSIEKSLAADVLATL
jgi:hypothetical protein